MSLGTLVLGFVELGTRGDVHSISTNWKQRLDWKLSNIVLNLRLQVGAGLSGTMYTWSGMVSQGKANPKSK